MVTVGVIGYGFVGKAMTRFYEQRYTTIWRDMDSGASTDAINNCDVGVICVNTPQSANGEADLSQVRSVLKWLNTPLIILKSSVPPGTTELLLKETGKPIVFSPEFVGETAWSVTNVSNSSFFVFGGDATLTAKAVQLYAAIGGPQKTYRQTDATKAELMKYLVNSYLAAKTTLCYEYDQICRALNVSYEDVRELWLLDARIGRSHTCVFDDNQQPYGGKCFPKDVIALVEQAKRLGYDACLLREVHESNLRLGRLRDDKA